jgi:hypothetical protein
MGYQCESEEQGGAGMRSGDERVIDTAMLESLALIAAANDRSLVEELNLAVQAYVLEQIPPRRGLERLQRAFAEPAQTGDRIPQESRSAIA